MSKYISVIDGKPNAAKKGLRIKVQSVRLDEDDNLLSLDIEYSGLHVRGEAIVDVSQINKVDLPEK